MKLTPAEILAQVKQYEEAASQMNALADSMIDAGGIPGSSSQVETMEALDHWRAGILKLYQAVSRVSDAMWLYLPEKFNRSNK